MTEAEAIDLSREYFKLNKSVRAAVFKVINLLNENSSYFLIIFGEENASVAIAAVNIRSGEIKNSARLTGQVPHLTINKEKAIELTASPKNSRTEMIWKPGRLTKSQLYPVWKIHSPTGIVYINQSGVIANDY
jgi:hypothetical protein